MSYVIALGVAALLIAVAVIAQWRIRVTVLREIRCELRRAKDAGAPSLADIDPETFELQDVGLALPQRIQRLIGIADVISRLWLIWAPITILACLGVAHALQ